MMQNGLEYATKEQFEVALASHTEHPDDGLAFLIKKGAVYPLPGLRLGFFHQSITEYLAGRVIARKYQQNPGVLLKLLGSKRWDQVLFLSVSMMDSSAAERLFDTLLAVDTAAAARAAFYVELEQTAVISRLLNHLRLLRPGRSLFQPSASAEALAFERRSCAVFTGTGAY
jgi:hypothetical protein